MRTIMVAEAEDLRVFRAKHNLTQDQMAELCQVTKTSISNWERPGCEPRDLYARLQVAEAALVAGKPQKPDRVAAKREAKMLEHIAAIRQNRAPFGETPIHWLEQYVTKPVIRGQRTASDIAKNREALAYCREHNILI